MSLSRKSAIGVAWLVGWRGFSRLLGVANTIILARLLVPADFGLVAMAMTFETSILMMSAFPIQDALLRRPEADTHLHDAAFTIQMGRALLLALIVAAAAPLAAAWFSEPRLTYLLYALAATTAVNGFSNIGIIEFQRELRFDLQVKTQLVPAILQIVVTVAVAWLTRSYWALIVGLAVSRVGRVALTYAIHPYRPRLSLKGWRQLAGFSFWLWLTSLAAMLWSQVDAFVIGPVFGSVGLGLYVVAGQVAALPTTELVQPVSSVLLASFAYSQRERNGSYANPLAIASALLLLLAPIALVISAGAASAASILLGGKWSGAVPLIAIGAGQCLFQPFNQIAGAALVARGHVRSQFVAAAIAAVVRTALLVGAATTKSLSIVVIATLAALAFYTLLCAVALRADLKSGLGSILTGIGRTLVATAAAAGALAASGFGWRLSEPLPTHLTAFIDIFSMGAIGAGTYLIALILIWIACGRPLGPERMVLNLLREFAPSRATRGIIDYVLNGSRRRIAARASGTNAPDA